MNDVQFVITIIKKLNYYCSPLELLAEINQDSQKQFTPIELDKILKELYDDNMFIYDKNGEIVWTYPDSKAIKKMLKESVLLK